MAITRTITKNAEVYTQWEYHPLRDLSDLFKRVKKYSGRVPDVFVPELQPRKITELDGTVWYQHRGPEEIRDEYGEKVFDYLRSNNIPVYLVDIPVPSSRKHEVYTKHFGVGFTVLGLTFIFSSLWNSLKKTLFLQQDRPDLEGTLLTNEDVKLSRRKFLEGFCKYSIFAAGLTTSPEFLGVGSAFPGDEGSIRKFFREESCELDSFVNGTYVVDARSAVWADRFNKIAEGIRNEKGRNAVIATNVGFGHGGLTNYLRDSSKRDRVLREFRRDFKSLPVSVNTISRINLNENGNATCTNIEMPLIND